MILNFYFPIHDPIKIEKQRSFSL